MGGNISNAEWVIMRVLWQKKEPMTSAEIVAQASGGRSPRTIKTLIQRLVAKGFVSVAQDAYDSRVYHYSPAFSEEECVRKENSNFVSLYYRGDVANMLARFIGDNDLSREQIAALKALLEDKAEETK